MPNNILITPGSASIDFSGSMAGNTLANTLRLQVLSDASVAITGSVGQIARFFPSGQVWVTSSAQSSIAAHQFTGSLGIVAFVGTASRVTDGSYLSEAQTYSALKTFTAGIALSNSNITGVNNITINDSGVDEGILWAGGNLWRIYESPNALTDAAGNLQIVQNTTRRATFNTSGQFEIPIATGTAPFLISSTTLVSNLNADLLDGYDTAIIATPSTVVVRDASGGMTGSLFGNATTATSASNVLWPNVGTGTRTDLNLDFKPLTSAIAGFEFTKSTSANGAADAGLLVVRGTSDSDVYTAEGITLVADGGWLTLAQRTTAGRGVKIMTGTTAANRVLFNTDGTVEYTGTTYNYSNAGQILFNHTTNNTNVPFDMRKGGTTISDDGTYGVLYLSRENTTNGATGAGSNLYFVVKDSGGTYREYAGIGGRKTVAGADGGALYFYRYGRNVLGYWDVNGLQAPVFYDYDSSGYYANFADTGTSINIQGSLRAATYNKPAILSVASGTASTGASFAIQQETSEGWTGIFVDFEPYTGWGFYHDNPNNYFSFTSEASTGQIRSFTVPSRVSGNRTAYEKFRIDQNNGDVTVGRTGYAQTSFNAPIFYDTNTAYYVDPASTSVLNEVTVSGWQVQQTLTLSVTAGNWYTIATNPGNRAEAMFHTWDYDSGLHHHQKFVAGVHFGSVGGTTLTLLGKSWYSAGGIAGNIRIRGTGTYDTHYLQIYANYTGTLYVAMTHNYHSSGWTLTNGGTGSPGGSTFAEIDPNSYRGLNTNAPIYTGTAMYAPIYYDANDANFYLDPSSTTFIRYLKVNTTGTSSGTRALTIRNEGQAEINFGSYPGAWTSALQIQNNDNTDFIWISPLQDGTSARFRTAGSGLDFYTDGANDAGTYSLFVGSGYAQGIVSLRAPIFYDSDSTSYYVDPANGGFYLRGGTSNRVTYLTNDSGIIVQNPEGNGITDVRLGAAWGQAGLYAPTYLSLGTSGTYIEFRFSNVQRGYIDSSGYMYASRFTDIDNAAYYVDPASTSNVVAIQSGTWYVNGTGFSIADTDQWPFFYWLRDTGNNWDEGLIKGSSSRGVWGRAHFGIHFSDQRSFAFHTSSWDTEMEIRGDGAIYMKGPVGINTTSTTYRLTAAGDIYANGGWLRVSGSQGLYFESYGGGWYMTDSTWIRSYNSKNVYVDTYIRAQGSFRVGSEWSIWAPWNTYSAYISRIAYISFDWNASYDLYYYHGIASTDLNGSFSDSMSINSFNDIILRLDSNDNNANSYVRFMDNSAGNNQFAYIGRESGSPVAYFGGAMYATVYYDANDGTYYLDPNSTSDQALRIRGGTLHGPNVTWGKYLLVGGDGRNNRVDDPNVASIATTNGNLHVDAASGYSLYLNYYDGGAIYFGGGAYNNWGEFSGGIFYAYNQMRSPIFYDYNNSGYYVDPNSSSFIRGRLDVQGGHGNSQIRITTNGPELGSGVTSTMTWWVSEPGVTWNAGGFGYNVTNDGGSPGGFSRLNGSYGQSYFRFDTDGNMYLYNTNTSGTRYLNMRFDPGYYVYVYNYLEAGGSLRAPIFYDSNDTGGYLDPREPTNGLRFYSAAGWWQLRGATHWDSQPGIDLTGGTSEFRISSTGGNVNLRVDGWMYAYDSSYFPFIYDQQNTGYYVDPNGSSQFAAVFANDWFRPQGCTGVYWQSYGRGIWSPECAGSGYGTIATYGGGRNGWAGYAIESRWVYMSTGGDNVGVHDNSRGNWLWYWDGGYTRWNFGYNYFAGDTRTWRYYDHDTGYYGDFNSDTNWQGLTDYGKMRIGLTAKGNFRRNDYTGDTNYWVGSMGWGTTDLISVFTWGSGFFDTWSNPANQPAGTSHWTGVQALHYVAGYNNGYGWQLVGGPISGAWWTSYWNTKRPWYKVAMYGLSEYSNDFYSTIMYDANNGGYYIDPDGTSRLNRIDTNESYTYGWHRNHNSGQGMYNQSTGMHWYTNNGYWKSAGGGYGYGGIVMYNNYESDLRGFAGYWDGSGFGMLNSSGNWQLRIEYGNANMELYRITYMNDARPYIIYDRDSTYYQLDPSGYSRSNQVSAFTFANNYDVSTDHTFGIRFTSGVYDTAYAIFREGGGWGYPYPDLRIAFHTGIKFGANPSYEGMRFYTDYDMSSIVWQFNGGSNYSYQYTWNQLTGYHGIYSGYNNAHWYPNPNTYGSWRAIGSRNGWGGIQFDNEIQLMMNQTVHGFYSNYYGWRLYLDGYLYCPGDIVAFWSDKRLKEDIRPLKDGEGLDVITKLIPSRFKWKQEARHVSNQIPIGREDVNLIAQEVQEIIPAAVVVNKAGNKISLESGEQLSEYFTVNHDKISPYLIQAIKDLKTELDELKQQLKKTG